MKNICLGPNLINFIFVKSMINAVKMAIGKYEKVNGCFDANTHRHVHKIGIKNNYRSDDEFSLLCR